MNRRQKKERLTRINQAQKAIAEEHARIERERLAALAKAEHRRLVKLLWDARRKERRLRELNTPKTSVGDW